jgi:K+-transporting ATPase KdpF subunit
LIFILPLLAVNRSLFALNAAQLRIGLGGNPDDRSRLHYAGGRFFRRVRVVRALGGGKVGAAMLYLIGGIIAAGLLIYLFVALLKPEIFS